MKCIILAGGTGSRLYPVTRVVNKHLLPVADKPMVYYPILSAFRAGLHDIIVVSDRDFLDNYKKLLNAENSFAKINFEFVAQERAGGIAQALGFCKKLVGNEKICVILGDNIFTEDFSSAIKNFASEGKGGKIFLKEVARPDRFGVAVFQGDKLMGIEDKPISPKSNYAISGLYLFDSQVWDIIENLRPSVRGELEITDVTTYYLKQGTLDYQHLTGEWFDVDTFSTLAKATNYFIKHVSK